MAGGVTESSARFIVFTSSPATVGIQVSFNASFNPVVAAATASTQMSCGHCVIIDIAGLQPNTRYYYRPLINGAVVTGDIRTFKTFPEQSDAVQWTIAFGSCMNENRSADVIFQEMMHHQIDLFLQIGDWGYPDYTDNLPQNPDFFPADYQRVIQAYKNKYDYTHMKEFLKNVAIDYVWDDHDYVNNNTSRFSASYTNFGIPVQVVEIPIPPDTRRNSIRGYYELFPGYAPVDSSEGIFHSFLCGNIEVFMLDNRAARSPNTEALVQVNGNWTFSPPAGHSILGNIQRQWLIDGLRKSTATWKLIVTGTAFNKTYGNTFTHLLNLPNLAGLPLMEALIDCWSGFPLDQDSLIHAVQYHHIDGVVILSGDTHTAAMDDGQNSGLPEIMAGCLSQTNSTLYTTVPLLQYGLAWNKGGQGISTNNYNNAFGKITIYGNDSLRMELIDENGVRIATHTLYSCSYVSGLKVQSTALPVTCRGASDGAVVLSATGGSPPYLYSLDGLSYQADSVLRHLPPGTYYPVVKDQQGCLRQTKTIITEAPNLSVNPVVTDVSCFSGEDGSIYFQISGGQPPYYYQWNNGQTTGALFDVPAGTYEATVTDAFGCQKTFQIIVNQPDSLYVGITETATSCLHSSNGAIKVIPAGGTPPYSIHWSDSTNTFTRNHLAAGSYPLTVIDTRGCMVYDTAVVPSPLPLVIEAVIIPDYSGQGEGAIYLHISGGNPPYRAIWLHGATGDTLEQLRAGAYLVQVTDANGCRASKSFTVPVGAYILEASSISLTLFPNPADHRLQVNIQLPIAMEVVCKIVDLMGRVVIRENVFIEKVAVVDLFVEHLPAGSYVLIAESEKFRKVIRFVIAR